MLALDRFLENRIDRLIGEYEQSRNADSIRVEILQVARLAGVTSIREIPMIPEAAMKPISGGFEILLQNNFLDAPGAKRRQRFSIAHEIGHTLFYDRTDDGWRPRKDAPTGEFLESACHQAAGMLLVPDQALRRVIREFAGFPRVAQLFEIARRFDVSMEVVIRRVHATVPGLFESSGRVPVLVRGPRELIEFVVLPPWLKPVLPRPKRGRRFVSWFRPGENDRFHKTIIPPYGEEDQPLDAKGNFILTLTRPGYGTIRAVRYPAGQSLGLYEITAELLSANE